MQLSSKQKEMISAFLRSQDKMFVDLPADQRVRALSQVKQRIRKELLWLKLDTISDLQVASLLSRLNVTVKPKVVEPDDQKTEKKVAEQAQKRTKPDPRENTSKGVTTKRRVDQSAAADSDAEALQKKAVKSREKPVTLATPPPAEDKTLKIVPPTWKAEEVAAPVEKPEKKPPVEKVKRAVKEETPATVAAMGRDSGSDSDDEVEDFGDRHWLGVCDDFAVRKGQSVGAIRTAFVLLGLLTGPVAVTAYLGIYISRTKRHPNDFPPMDQGRVIAALLRLLGITAGMFGVSWILKFGAAVAFLNYFGVLPEVEMWGMMEQYDVAVFAFVLVSLAPFAALSALPLAYNWGKSISTIVNAVVAVYAVVISVGLAMTLVGYAFGVLDQLEG